jgi:hypothetical protein
MKVQTFFERNELKYLLSIEQANELKRLLSDRMRPDEYGKTTICNLYFDTPSFLLIRQSLEKPTYKEKVRLRSYGVASNNKMVFVEIKKKYKGLVSKRRLAMPESDAMACMMGNHIFPTTQIGKELSYCFTRYHPLSPKVFLSYDREAFYGREARDFRITFDENILWRDYDLSLSSGIYGNQLLSEHEVLLEVKHVGALPLWLVHFLSEHRIYKTSFSKYGNAYLEMMEKEPLRRLL